MDETAEAIISEIEKSYEMAPVFNTDKRGGGVLYRLERKPFAGMDKEEFEYGD